MVEEKEKRRRCDGKCEPSDYEWTWEIFNPRYLVFVSNKRMICSFRGNSDTHGEYLVYFNIVLILVKKKNIVLILLKMYTHQTNSKIV